MTHATNEPQNMITGLRFQKRNPDRVNVYLDGEYAFALQATAAAQLRKGQQLSAAEIAGFKAEDEKVKAYNRAARFLGYRPRSRAEVVRYLRGKQYDEPVVSYAVERLSREGYLDDAAFARFWVENRERFKPRSARALRHELRGKGVDAAAIDAALADLDEADSAWAALEPKLDRWRHLDPDTFQQRVLGHLARRGFGYHTARATLEHALEFLQGDGEDD